MSSPRHSKTKQVAIKMKAPMPKPKSKPTITRPAKKKKTRAKRSYNRYNIYFILERKNILHGKATSTDLLEPNAAEPAAPTQERGYENLNLPPLPSRFAHLSIPDDWCIPGKHTEQKRKHKKSHGLTSFKDMASIIAASWKVVDEETFEYCCEVEKILKLRFIELGIKRARGEDCGDEEEEKNSDGVKSKSPGSNDTKSFQHLAQTENNNMNNMTVKLRWDNKRICLGTYPYIEAVDKFERAYDHARQWRKLSPKPPVEWVSAQLQKLGLRRDCHPSEIGSSVDMERAEVIHPGAHADRLKHARYWARQWCKRSPAPSTECASSMRGEIGLLEDSCSNDSGVNDKCGKPSINAEIRPENIDEQAIELRHIVCAPQGKREATTTLQETNMNKGPRNDSVVDNLPKNHKLPTEIQQSTSQQLKLCQPQQSGALARLLLEQIVDNPLQNSNIPPAPNVSPPAIGDFGKSVTPPANSSHVVTAYGLQSETSARKHTAFALLLQAGWKAAMDEKRGKMYYYRHIPDRIPPAKRARLTPPAGSGGVEETNTGIGVVRAAGALLPDVATSFGNNFLAMLPRGELDAGEGAAQDRPSTH